VIGSFNDNSGDDDSDSEMTGITNVTRVDSGSDMT
jgi:hypothetical protein